MTLAINYGAKKNGLFNRGARTGRKMKFLYPRDVYKLNNLFLETYASIDRSVARHKERKTGLNASLYIYNVFLRARHTPKMETGSMEQTPRFTLHSQHVGCIFIRV